MNRAIEGWSPTVPEVAPILVARKGAFLFVVGSMILIAVLGFQLGGWLVAAATVILLASNQMFQDTMVTAMGDAGLLGFDLLAIGCLLWYEKHQSHLSDGKKIAMLLLMGGVAGLAMATKLNGILCGGFI